MPIVPQPRQYRLRIYDGTYEVLHDRMHIIDLDLTRPGYATTLSWWLGELTRQAEVAGELMEHPRLEVYDVLTGDRVRDWTGA